jgi:hypothetical protein
MNGNVKQIRSLGSVACALGLCVATALAEEPTAKPPEAALRVGTYDSRSVVIAYFFSPAYNSSEEGRKVIELSAEMKKAKAEGNQTRVAQAEAKLRNLVNTVMIPRHKQAFSTAPVDDLLVHIRDQMPEIAKTAGVGPIVSKWDKEALAKYPSATLVDVTMEMVNAFHPISKQLKAAAEIQKKDPIPLEQANKMDWTKE